jgi:uncharacterized protein DUF4304
MLRSSVAPALRSHGFKGSGQKFELPDDRYWALLGFQKSVSSDKTTVKFTVNLVVVDKSEYADARAEQSYLSAKPSPNLRGGPGWWERIGSVMPEGRDLWWKIVDGVSSDEVSEQVLRAIGEFGIPAIRARMA